MIYITIVETYQEKMGWYIYKSSLQHLIIGHQLYKII